VKKPNTIDEAIAEAFKREGKPLRVRDVYLRIKEDNLYQFNTTTPEQVVRTALRRHSESLSFASSSKVKLYVTLDDGTYWLKNKPFSQPAKLLAEAKSDTEILERLKAMHNQYVAIVKEDILTKLKGLNPFAFESFCRHLLKVYGFSNVRVTKKTRDGGIDGDGDFKIGLLQVRVAFECKRYNTIVIGRTYIDRFRGSMAGDFLQGIFFTTSKFSKDAKDIAFKKAAIPIVLIDGEEIVNIMIEKRIGVQVEELPMYDYDVDSIINNLN
jgi:restriction system protein